MGHWEPCSDVEAVAARESGVEVQAEHHVGHKDWRDIDGVVGHQIPCWRGSGALIHAVGRHFRRWVAGAGTTSTFRGGRLMATFIAVDFGGTIVDHSFPEIGTEVPGAFRWLRAFKAAGAQLILWTMRSDRGAELFLSDAAAYCEQRGVHFDFLNEHPQEWTSSPKAYAHVYIDDAAAGCPLRENPRMGGRPYVDWDAIGPDILNAIYGEDVD